MKRVHDNKSITKEIQTRDRLSRPWNWKLCETLIEIILIWIIVKKKSCQRLLLSKDYGDKERLNSSFSIILRLEDLFNPLRLEEVYKKRFRVIDRHWIYCRIIWLWRSHKSRILVKLCHQEKIQLKMNLNLNFNRITSWSDSHLQSQ